MPLTSYGEISIAYPLIFGSGAQPSTYYLGLAVASGHIATGGQTGVWTASQAYSVGEYMIPSGFNAGSNRIYYCIQAGTTGTTMSGFAYTAGEKVITNGTAWWQEVATTATVSGFVGWLGSGPTFSAAEPSGNSYARVSVTNNVTNFPAPTGQAPTTGYLGTTESFPTSTGAWGVVAGIWIATVTTVGNSASTMAWAYLTSYLYIASANITAQVVSGSSGLTITLT